MMSSAIISMGFFKTAAFSSGGEDTFLMNYKTLNTAVFSHYAKKVYKMGTLYWYCLAFSCGSIYYAVHFTAARTVYNSKITVNLPVLLPVLYVSAIPTASSLTPLYLCIIFPYYQMIIMLGIICLILLEILVIYHKVCQMQLYV